MTTTRLEKTEWETFFNRVSDELTGKQAEIEAVALNIGGQIEADWLPLIGLVYESRTDTLEVATEGLDHLIHKPREIYAELGVEGLESLAIIDAQGATQIVKFRDPLMLPPPAAS